MSSERFQQPMEDFAQESPVVIFGGHYSVSNKLCHLSADGVAEMTSFDVALKLYARVRSLAKIQPTLVLLVNDIGISKERRDSLKIDYRVPDNYRRSMEKWGVTGTEVTIEFESSMRNRAAKNIKQIYKRRPQLFQITASTMQGLERCIDKDFCDTSESIVNCYTIKGPNDRELVLKEGTTPKCNLILASLFHKYTYANPGATVINVLNAIYKNRISLGSFVYRNVFQGSALLYDIYTTPSGKVIFDRPYCGLPPAWLQCFNR